MTTFPKRKFLMNDRETARWPLPKILDFILNVYLKSISTPDTHTHMQSKTSTSEGIYSMAEAVVLRALPPTTPPTSPHLLPGGNPVISASNADSYIIYLWSTLECSTLSTGISQKLYAPGFFSELCEISPALLFLWSWRAGPGGGGVCSEGWDTGWG